MEDAGKNKLLVNGIHQSSEYIRKFWTHAVAHLGVANIAPPKKIVILGVAGGTIIHILSKMFPKAALTGVDIDSVMIEMGKKYFSLGNIPNLFLVTCDARSFVSKSKGKYDLVVVDIYLARDLPNFLCDRKFLGDVRASLAPHGYVLINYLRDGEYEKKAQELEKKLQDIYTEVRYTNYLNNRFFLARK